MEITVNHVPGTAGDLLKVLLYVVMYNEDISVYKHNDEHGGYTVILFTPSNTLTGINHQVGCVAWPLLNAGDSPIVVTNSTNVSREAGSPPIYKSHNIIHYLNDAVKNPYEPGEIVIVPRSPSGWEWTTQSFSTKIRSFNLECLLPYTSYESCLEHYRNCCVELKEKMDDHEWMNKLKKETIVVNIEDMFEWKKVNQLLSKLCKTNKYSLERCETIYKVWLSHQTVKYDKWK